MAQNYWTKYLISSQITKQFTNKSFVYLNKRFIRNGNTVGYNHLKVSQLNSIQLNSSPNLSINGSKILYSKDLNSVRNLTISSKSKTLLKDENQLKLAQILSKSRIDFFPLLKEKDFEIKNFENEYKDFFELINVCEKNKLNNSLYYPSVTTILSSTLSVQSLVALDKWKKMKISEMGEKGFRDYQKNILSRGKLLHNNIKNFIQTKDESTLVINESIEKLWKSLSTVLDDIKEVKLCETPITHPFLYYKGIVDCVAHYSDKPVIIEWKTSEKLKPSLKDIYDNPLQAVAYLGAINYETQHNNCLPINEIILVYAYEDGTNAQIHHLSADQCKHYWKQWLSRVKSYWDLIAFKQTIT